MFVTGVPFIIIIIIINHLIKAFLTFTYKIEIKKEKDTHTHTHTHTYIVQIEKYKAKQSYYSNTVT